MRGVGAAVVCAVVLAAGSAHAWRSSLYPASWDPSFTDGSGRFLHDFSYAGYHRGEDPLPDAPPGGVLDVTAAPYDADPSGVADATDAIQQAIDAAGAAGGGVVYLPAGTYRVSPRAGANHALLIRHDNVVLRGDGPGATFLFNDQPMMRGKRVILVAPRAEYYAWVWGMDDERRLTANALSRDTVLHVDGVSGIAPGDWVLLRADATDAFIAEHGMTGTWTLADTAGPTQYRRIEAVDAAAGTITVDAPIRYDYLTRDDARIGRPPLAHVSEVGIEGLSIGMRENGTDGTDSSDYSVPGTGAYQMHDSFFIYFDHVVNGWVRDVDSYRPAGNGRDVHLLSNGIRLDFSRFVTVEGVHLQKPQYEGAGGNGYLFTLTGNDCLVTRSSATDGRHNYSLSFMWSNGNVIHRSVARDGRLPVDFHQRLATANLIDNLTVDNDSVEAVFRDCCGHGHSSTENVLWNTLGVSYPDDQWFERFIVESQQYGVGYVIGTQGAATNVKLPSGDGTGPRDFLEGEGTGDGLEPQSLYEDQRARRLGTDTPDPVDAGVPTPDAGTGGRDAGPAGGDGGVLPGVDGGGALPGTDGGGPGAGPGDDPRATGGCACDASPGAPAAWPLLAVALLLLARRRQ